MAENFRVTVARPNPQHSAQLAVGLQKSGLLETYITGIYLSWEHIPMKFFRWLPLWFRNQIEVSIFSRYKRTHSELNPNLVISIDPWVNMAMALLHRAGVSAPWQMSFFRRRLALFQEKVAHHSLENANILIVYDTEAYHALRSTQNTSLIRIVDMATIHWKTRDRVFREEAERWPEYSQSIDLPSNYPKHLEQLSIEAETADYILVGSQLAKASFVENGCDPEKIYIAYYGCDTQLFQPGNERRSSDRPFNIIFVGSPSIAKGYHYMLMTLKGLQDLDLEVNCCGLSQRKGIQIESIGNIRVNSMGYRSQEQLAQIMRKADLLFHPSILDSFSLTCLEAMSSAVPVLTTNLVGASEIIDHERDGFVVQSGDIEAMQSVVRFLYNNSQAKYQIGISAREKALLHTWEDYQEDVVKIIKEIYFRNRNPGYLPG